MTEKYQRWSAGAVFRILWAVFSCFVTESVVFGLAVVPAAIFWQWHFQWNTVSLWIRILILGMSFIPAYILFAFSLMVLSAFAMRIMGWRTPENAEQSIQRMDWPLLNWVRYIVSIHIVRIFAGPVFRSTPLWTLYMRLNGAHIGHRVFVNSLWVTDHNLLHFGNDVVIGGEAHLSGHTVEHGIVRTAEVHLADGVTVGVSSVVGIGVNAGAGCHIGALSVVPKFSKLEAGRIYAGVPIRVIESEQKTGA